MPEDTISKPRAKRIRLLSQAAALLCVLAAVAAVLFGIPLLSGTPVETVAWSEVQAKSGELHREILARRSDQQTGDDNALPADLGMIQDLLSSVENAPKVKAAPNPDQGTGTETGDKGDTANAPPPVSAKTRFVGTVGIGDRLMALVTAGGSQRIMGEGDEAVLPLADGDSSDPPSVSIRSVSPGEVVIVENGTEHTIEKAQRTGIAVSTSMASVAPAQESDGPAPARTGGVMQADDIKPVNPDDFRRDDGTIDYEALRKAARERARQRQELRQQRREESGDAN